MSRFRKNPDDINVAQVAGLAGSTPDAPGQGRPGSNGNPAPARDGSAQGGNGSAPTRETSVMSAASEDPPQPPNTPGAPQPPPDSQGAPQPPPQDFPQPPPQPAPQGVPQPPPSPLPPGVAPPPAAGQPPAAAPGYYPGQGVPPQPPPGYPAYQQQPGGPYERRGLMQAWYEYPGLRWLTVILALAVIALLVWLLAFKSDGSSSATVQPGGGPVGVTQEELVALSQRLNQPIYWAGNVSGTRMELTETTSSYAYLRYLTSDAPVGDASPNFLTVGTYPQLDAFDNLNQYAKHNQANTDQIQNGGIAVTIPHSPTSVYFAFPHQDVQVEVYDPRPGQALDMVKSGQVVPVPGGVTTSSGVASAPAVPTGSATASPTISTTPTTATPPIPGG